MKQAVFMLLIIMFITLVFPVFGQKVQYVNIEESKNEMEEKKTENQDLRIAVNDMRLENEQLSEEIAQNNYTVFKISEVIGTIDYLLRTMHIILENTKNEEYKGEIQAFIDDNENKRETLQEKQKSIHETTDAKKSQLEENKAQIRVMNDQMETNQNRIFYLKSAMSETQKIEDKIKAYSQKIDDMIEQLELED